MHCLGMLARDKVLITFKYVNYLKVGVFGQSLMLGIRVAKSCTAVSAQKSL